MNLNSLIWQINSKKYKDKLRFFIGDVRDKERLYRAFDGVDYVVHAAALKQVPSCEFFPIEAVKTNVLGTENVLTAAIEEGVKRSSVFLPIRQLIR